MILIGNLKQYEKVQVNSVIAEDDYTKETK